MRQGDGDRTDAIEYYRQAAGLYMTDNSRVTADPCLVRLGMLAAEEARYDEAISAFETVAAHYLDSAMLKTRANTHYLNARE